MNSEQLAVVETIYSEQLAINNVDVQCSKFKVVTSSDPTKEDCIEKGFQ